MPKLVDEKVEINCGFCKKSTVHLFRELKTNAVIVSCTVCGRRKKLLQCRRCGNVWDYKGKSEYYAPCSNCKSSVRLK